MTRQDAPHQLLLSRVRIVGTLAKKLPLYRERGVNRATIVVRQYTIHLSGRDATTTQSLQLGECVESTSWAAQSAARDQWRVG